MKKIMMIVFCLVMLFALAACGSDPVPTETTTRPGATTSSVAKPTEPTDPTEPPHVHDWQASTCTAPQTCLECGETRGDANGHEWQEATTLRPKTCKVCGMTEGGVIYDMPDDNSVAIPENDCFEKDTVVKVEAITSGTAMETVDQAMETFAEQYVAYEFTATKEEVAVQPVGKLTVTFAIPDGFSTNVSVFYIPEEGYMEQLDAVVDATARTVTVELKHFSTYGMVDEETVIHEHSYEYQTSAPTCTLDGYTLQSCTECEHVHKSELVDALGHNWIGDICTETRICDVCGAQDPARGHQWTPATCTEPKTCSVCHETEGQANGHAWMDATCTTAQTCTVCHDVGELEKGHRWDAGVLTKEPTEEAEGEKRYTCTDCGETKKEIIPELNHEHQYTAKITEPTCTNRGYTTYTCRCGETYDDAFVDENGHTWVNADCTTPQTCSVCQAVEGEALGHKWEDATCTTPKTCRTCQETEGDVAEHTWDDGVVTKEATEEAEGEKLYTCTTCPATKTEVIQKLDHVHQYEAEVTAPTCEKDGYTTYTCRCGDTYTSDKTAATGHVWTPATCTTPKTCSECQTTEGEVAEHPWDDGVVTKEATEEAEGEKLYTCTTCPATKTEVIQKLDHVHQYEAKVTAPTCTEKGYTTYTCRCGDTYTDAETSATGHTYGQGDITAPTCTDKGFTTYTCHCGHEKVANETAATGHQWKDATCTEVKKCTVCQATHGEALGHSWKAATCTEPETCSRCEITQGDPRGHSCEAGTCDYCGVTLKPYSQGLEFRLSYDGTYYMLEGMGTCSDTEVNVPPTYNGLPVKEISWIDVGWKEPNVNMTTMIIPDSVTMITSDAFSKCKNLRHIIFTGNANFIFSDGVLYNKPVTEIIWVSEHIPSNLVILNGVTSIGNYAFQNCTGLTSITIPASVTSIGYYAFSGCTGLTSITIPDSVTSIGSSAFQACTGLTSITIPASVTSIGSSAFRNCTGLTSITIPDSVTSIDRDAFSGCTGLTSITIPASVTSIGNYAFWNCTGLTSITILAGVTSIGDYAFSGCTGLTSITIPNSVTSIGSSAFRNCTGLTSITIPDSVTSIGNYAFQDCTGLTSITILAGVTSIGDYTFRNCTGLTSITIPASVTSIGNYAFQDCTGLTSITIPNSVTKISKSAFSGCTNLKSIILSANAKFRFEGGILYDNPVRSIVWVSECISGDVIILNGVYSIDSGYFNNRDKITSITIPRTLNSLAADSFQGCTSIETFYVQDGDLYTSFYTDEYGVLYYGKTLKAVPNKFSGAYVIPEGVTVSGGAFSNLPGLTCITIPFSAIGASFNNCTNLRTVIFTGESAKKTTLGWFAGCTSLTEIVIPYGVTCIAQDTFMDCINLERVIFPRGLTTIESWAFENCTSLKEIVIPEDVTTVGMYAFVNCTNLSKITFVGNAPSIGYNALSNVKTTVYYAADNNTWTSSVKNNYGGTTTWKTYDPATEGALEYALSKDGSYYILVGLGTIRQSAIVIPSTHNGLPVGEIAAGLFAGYTALTSITIPESVVAIGDYAFDGCTALTNITIPESLKAIGDYAFRGCTDLKGVVIPAEVEIIGHYAFSGCSALKNVTISEGVVIIGDYAFYGCAALINVTIPGSVVKIGAHSFNACNALSNVTIQKGVQTIGTHAFYTCANLTSIAIPDSVTAIESAAFNPKLKSVYITDFSKWLEIEFDGNPLNDGAQLYLNGKKVDLSNITIPEGTTKLGHGALGGFNVTTLVIPDSVKSIAEGIFYSCSSLTTIIVSENSNFYFENGILYDKPITKILWVSQLISGDVTILDGVTEIGGFSGSKITSISIPDSVTEIGVGAFYGCEQLVSVKLPKNITMIPLNAFTGCKKLESITIPDGVTIIEDSAFNNCDSLKTITIPGSVISIEMNAFHSCDNLTEVIILEGVKRIDWFAFGDCINLTRVVIPSSLEELSVAFVNTRKLTITFQGTKAQWRKFTADYCVVEVPNSYEDGPDLVAYYVPVKCKDGTI